MQTTPQIGLQNLEEAGNGQPRLRQDCVYQAVTVAAILAVLATVWIF